MGVGDGRTVLRLLGTDAAVESRDDAMAAGVIVRCELLVEASIGNTGTCDKDAAGMLTETPVSNGWNVEYEEHDTNSGALSRPVGDHYDCIIYTAVTTNQYQGEMEQCHQSCLLPECGGGRGGSPHARGGAVNCQAIMLTHAGRGGEL